MRMGAEEGTFCPNGHFYDPSASRCCVRCAVAEYPQSDPSPKRMSWRRRRLIRRMNRVVPGWGDSMRWPRMSESPRRKAS